MRWKCFKIFFCVYCGNKKQPFTFFEKFSESHMIKNASLFLKLLVLTLNDKNNLMSDSKVSLF